MLRERRALLPGDIARYAYQPAGQEDSTLLLLTRRRTVVVTPHQMRSYARDSVRREMDLEIHGGLSFRLVIHVPGTSPRAGELADTVYRSLSFRDMMQLRPELNRSENGAAAKRPAVRPRQPPPPPPPPHRTTPRGRTRGSARRRG